MAQLTTPTPTSAPGTEIHTEGDEIFAANNKIVLILCGLVASGKSTFAEALEKHFPRFRRCNQDDLGSRREVERVTREFLGLGYSVCVDRTNFDATQRSHWLKIAREFPGTVVYVIVFDTPFEICAERLRNRISHPTIKSAEEGMPILARFAKDFRHPDPREGYDCILYLQPPASPNAGGNQGVASDVLGVGAENTAEYYTKTEVSSILQRVRDSPVVIPPDEPRLASASSPPNSFVGAASIYPSSSGASSRGPVFSRRRPHGHRGQQGSTPGHPSHPSLEAASRQTRYNASQRTRENQSGANWADSHS